MNKKLTDYVIDLVEILNKQQKQVFWGVFDIVSMVVSIIVSYILFYGLINPAPVDYVIYTGLAFLFYQIMIGFWGLNASISRYSKITDFLKIFFGVTVSSIVSYGLCYAFLPLFSIRFIVLFILLSTFLILLPRITWQLIYSKRKQGSGEGEHRRTFLIGAGDGGALFMNSYQHPTSDLELVGILDNDEKKKGQKLGGISVLGSYDNLPELAKRHQIERVIVAIPSLDPSEYERILQMCNKLGIKCYKMPKVETVVQGLHQSGSGFQKIDITDLLGRQEIRLDESRLGAELTGKTILVTGAGGSIGSEICRQVSRFNPERVILLGHGENSIYLVYHELIRTFQGIDYVPVIADIQDYDRLLQVFEQYKPAIVYHAAAPMISTDKAVNPPNVMGATKRVAELIVTGFNQRSKSTYCAVRFGNVLGSRGSVIPVFERQIAEGGPVTVTDFRMTRYFMTIPEASRLVIHAGAYAKDGEVFILDMGKPVKIYDLAKKMVLLSGHTESEIPIVEVGIRPGEKLYEELLVSTELVDNQVMDKIFVGKVNVMPLEAINQKIEEFRSLSGDELKEAIISFANETTHIE